MMNTKEFVILEQQIEILKSEKNIVIGNEEFAKAVLKQIGYFSLMGGYKHLFRIPETKRYKEGTTFEEIFALYEFDAGLRELFFKYLLQIERHMRSLMSYYFTELYGIEQEKYLNENNYNNTRRTHTIIVRLIATLQRAASTGDYNYINYYRSRYSNIPLWVLTNVLTFGNLSKMYQVFPQSLKSKIAREFAPLNQRQMDQFLSVLTKYRNVCAHGERLFTYKTVDAIADMPLHNKLSIPKKGNQYIYGKQDLFAVVIVFRYLLSKKDFYIFKRNLVRSIEVVTKRISHVSKAELLAQMGFPDNWKNITRYGLK